MRLSTRDLFAIVTFTAILAVFAGRTGFVHPFYWITVGISLVLGWIFVQRPSKGMAPITAGVAFALFTLFFGTFGTVIVGGLLLLAGIACRFAAPVTVRGRCYIAMACIAGGIGLSMIPGYIDQGLLEEMRRNFPIESLEPRLAYEAKASLSSPPVLQSAVARQLATVESTADDKGWRRWQLERIHRRQYDQFASAAGFGPIRMASQRVQSIETPKLQDIPYRQSAQTNVDMTDDTWNISQPSGATGAIENVHELSRDDFLHPEGYGAVISPRNQIAGFIEHAFHRHPLRTVNPPKWSLERIELVSLLKFDEPRVYVLDHLPRMDQLTSDTIPTRELDDFENSALAKLRTDEDTVVTNTGADYRMLGSLRAAKQCLECHNVQRGELLGAFSYRLTLTEDPNEDEEPPTTDLSTDDATGERSP